ncbi:MAG: carboxypeptidase regulatory-like domain-containing protein [FCB group bacterium]|jgi:hypothetical protein
MRTILQSLLKNSISILLLVIVSVLSIYSQQQPPNPPLNFAVSIEQTATDNMVKLTWTRDSSGTIPMMFNIYMAPKATDDIKDFKYFTSVKNINSMTDFKYYVQHLFDGTYSFYMTASVPGTNSFKMLESSPTQIEKIDVTQLPYLYLPPIPPMTITTGNEFTFIVKPQTNSKCQVDFGFDGPTPDNMTIGYNDGIIKWTPLAALGASVAVKAHLDCDSTVVAFTKLLINVTDKKPDSPFVHIVSQPMLKVKVNENWMYQIKAETNVYCMILYDFYGDMPDGMKFDKQIGMLSWVPTKTGVYELGVKAYFNDCDSTVFDIQKFTLTVTDGTENKPCATLVGTVSFEDSTLVNAGYIKIINVNPDPSAIMPGYSANVINGNFKVYLQEGEYVLYISGDAIKPEWYENADNLADATKIDIKCQDSISINIVVTKIPPPKTYNVSGRVYKQDDGSPVIAAVEFIPLQNMYNKDPNGNTKQPPSFGTKTDDKGNYTIALPDANTYIAHVMSMMNSIQFCDQYYNQVSNPLEADLIVLTGDVTGIDFPLKTCNPTNYGINGIVTNENGDKLKSQIIASLLTPDPTANNKNFVQVIESNDDGTFKFSNLLPGDYVLLSIPSDKTNIPGYYKLNDFATLLWRDATKITVGDGMQDITYAIKHHIRSGVGGVAQINGTVTQNKGSIGKLVNNPLAQGEPVAGAYVYVIDKNNNVIDYTFSDNLGKFNMQELGQGTYYLIADKVGFSSTKQEIATDYKSNSNLNLDIQINPSVTVVNDQVNNGALNLNISPEPVEETAAIQFNAKNGFTDINIYNNIGERVLSFQIKSHDGTNDFIFNTSTLPVGTYYINVVNGTSVNTIPMRVYR